MIIILLVFFFIYLIYDLLYGINEKFDNETNINYNVIHLKNINNNNNSRYNNIKNNELKLNKKNNKLKINFFDAINGSDIDLNNLSLYDSRINLNFKYNYIGEIGCYLSHMLLIKSFINSKNKYSVVFEDDLKILDDDLDDKIKKIIEKLNGNFDIIYLGNLNNNHGEQIINDIYTINKSEYLWGTHAYIVNNKSVEKIYNSLLNINIAIDNKLKYNIDNNILKGYVIYPILVSQNSSEFNSNIRPDAYVA